MLNSWGWLLQSVGMQMRSLKIAFVLAPLVIASYVIGLPYGPKGVAFAYSAAMTIALVPIISWCIHGTIFTSKDILQTISRPFVSCIVASFITFFIRTYSSQWLSTLPILLLGAVVMFGSYILLLLFVMGQKAFYLELIRGMRGSASSKAKETIGSTVQ
jgi:hypothetical protein